MTAPRMSGVAIRPYERSDAEDLFEAARESVAEVFPFLPWCHPDYRIEEALAWIEQQALAFGERRSFEFAVRSQSGRFLGGCGLNGIDWLNRRANLGYWVRSSATGRGVAASAVRQLAAWAFDRTELERLEIVASVRNVGSQRAAEKAGATREGIARRRLYLHGEMHDAVLFSLVRGDPTAR